MNIFKYFRDKRVEKIKESIHKKNIVKRYLMLIVGCFILATGFNLFFLEYNIVCLGMSGVSIVLSEFGVDPSLFLLISNGILLVISYFVLGKETTMNQVVGAIVYPLFITLTGLFTKYIDFGNLEMIIVAILGGVTAGVGYGLIYKSNFGSGGTDIIIDIMCKYLKMSMGSAGLITNILIILFGKVVFSWDTILYAILVSYIISILTDKILLGISKSKAFYIVTSKKEEQIIKSFLLSVKGVGVTVMDAVGGYENEEKSLLLAVVPTREYYYVKEGLKEINSDLFFLVCDSYEVSNDKGDYLCY